MSTWPDSAADPAVQEATPDTDLPARTSAPPATFAQRRRFFILREEPSSDPFCEARRAGTYAASIAAMHKTAAANASVAGFVASSPKSRLFMKRPGRQAKPQHPTPYQRQDQCDVAQDQPCHRAFRRTQRHANSDLSPPSRRRIRNHAIKSDGRKQKRQHSEEGRKQGNQTRLHQRIRDLRIQRVDFQRTRPC